MPGELAEITQQLSTTACHVVDSLTSFWARTSGQFVSALAGALFGALAAYLFQTRKENRQTKQAQCAAIQKAQIVLVTQLNSLEGLRNTVLEPHRNDAQREVQLPMSNQTATELSVDIASLAFLVDVYDANLIRDVYLADRAYFTSFRLLETRNQYFREFFESSRVVQFDAQTGRSKLDPNPMALKLLRDATNGLYDSVDDSISQVSKAVETLKKSGVKLFPGHKFLTYESYSKPCPKADKSATKLGNGITETASKTGP